MKASISARADAAAGSLGRVVGVLSLRSLAIAQSSVRAADSLAHKVAISGGRRNGPAGAPSRPTRSWYRRMNRIQDAVQRDAHETLLEMSRNSSDHRCTSSSNRAVKGYNLW
jgi:hypothetical protein